MVDSTLHWNPILNGFSGAEPIDFKLNMLKLAQLPQPEALKVFTGQGVTALALHKSIDTNQRKQILEFFAHSALAETIFISENEQLILIKVVKDRAIDTKKIGR
jgi:hypothetical protein